MVQQTMLEAHRQQAIQTERLLQIAEALERLPEGQREALELHYWQGWPLSEIAERLGRSTPAVAGPLQRGLRQLRCLLHETVE